MCAGNRFKPYCLPYSANRSVPYSVRLVYLFAPWLIASVCRVPYLYSERVFSFFDQCFSNVERKRRVSACMAAYLDSVHPDIGFPVDGSEIEQYVFPFPVCRNSECPCIYEFLGVSESLSDPGESGFDSERHQNFSVSFSGRKCLSFVYDSVFPQPVKVQP